MQGCLAANSVILFQLHTITLSPQLLYGNLTLFVFPTALFGLISQLLQVFCYRLSFYENEGLYGRFQ